MNSVVFLNPVMSYWGYLELKAQWSEEFTQQKTSQKLYKIWPHVELLPQQYIMAINLNIFIVALDNWQLYRWWVLYIYITYLS